MAKELKSKLKGVTFTNSDGENRQEIIKNFVKTNQRLLFEFEPNNHYFKYSVAALIETEFDKKQIGYLSNDLAINFYNRLDQIEGYVSGITGLNDDSKSLGVNIKLVVPDEKYPWKFLITVDLLKGAMNRFGDDFSEYSDIELGLDDEYSENIAVYSYLSDDILKRTKIGSIDIENTNKLYWYENNGFSISPLIESVVRNNDDVPEKVHLVILIETNEQYNERINRIREELARKSQERELVNNISIPKIKNNINNQESNNDSKKLDIKKIFQKPSPRATSEKSRTIALILCILLGYFGGHQFYAGRKGLGIFYFFTVGGFVIGWAIDFILIILGQYKDKYGFYISDW